MCEFVKDIILTRLGLEHGRRESVAGRWSRINNSTARVPLINKIFGKGGQRVRHVRFTLPLFLNKRVRQTWIPIVLSTNYLKYLHVNFPFFMTRSFATRVPGSFLFSGRESNKIRLRM